MADRPMADFEYLTHHVEIIDGKEVLHHCLLYDHVANMFEQKHMLVKDGKVFLGGKQITDGIFHIVSGLEPSQQCCWSDEDATDAGVRPKKMVPGMTKKQKAKEW